MNNPFYELYKTSRNLLDRYNMEKDKDDPPGLEDVVKGWREIIDAIHESHPQVKNWYEKNKSIQKSFSKEQIDHICYQIGDWYLIRKPLLEGQHNLGYMKEKLKTMICGD